MQATICNDCLKPINPGEPYFMATVQKVQDSGAGLTVVAAAVQLDWHEEHAPKPVQDAFAEPERPVDEF